MTDPHDLARFRTAQAGVMADVLAELGAGRKRTHWMWFVFPQLAGLGHSATARRYAIRDLAEARAYLADPVLGRRLLDCTALVNGLSGRSLGQIFGHPDDLKFRSCMTLFERVAGPGSVFSVALAGHCAGQRDGLTQRLLDPAGQGNAEWT